MSCEDLLVVRVPRAAASILSHGALLMSTHPFWTPGWRSSTRRQPLTASALGCLHRMSLEGRGYGWHRSSCPPVATRGSSLLATAPSGMSCLGQHRGAGDAFCASSTRSAAWRAPALLPEAILAPLPSQRPSCSPGLSPGTSSTSSPASTPPPAAHGRRSVLAGSVSSYS